MKVTNLAKALKKEGYEIQIKVTEFMQRIGGPGTKILGIVLRQHFYCKNKGQQCSWFSDDGEDFVQNLQCKPVKEQTDIQSDYFPGYFPKTIKSLITSMKG